MHVYKYSAENRGTGLPWSEGAWLVMAHQMKFFASEIFYQEFGQSALVLASFVCCLPAAVARDLLVR